MQSSFQADFLQPTAGWRAPGWDPMAWFQRARDFMSGREETALGEARAIDRWMAGERLRSGERFSEMFRWAFIVTFFLLDVFQPQGRGGWLVTGILLGVWALGNAGITVALAHGYRPSRWFCYATTGLDILIASALIETSGGLSSPFYLAFFLVIVSSAMRFGLLASAFTAAISSLLYLYAGGYTTTALLGVTSNIEDTLSKVFVFLVVGVITGMMAQEMSRERQLAVGRAAEKDTLQVMSNEISASIVLEEVLNTVLQKALRITGGSDGRLLTVPAEGKDIKGRHVNGTTALVLEVLGSAEEIRKPRIVERGTRMMVPVVASYSEDLYVIDLRSRHGFSQRQFDMVAALARNAAGPINNCLRYLIKATEATTDSLTGLVNQKEMRRLLGVLVKRAKEGNQGPFAVMLIDLDHFKSVNDTLGHEHGNSVLKQAAALINKCTRAHDVVIRYGGDEMAVVLTEATLAEADQAAKRVVEAVREAHIKATPEASLTFSVGVAAYPDHANSVDGLLEAADQGLYLVKRAGRDGAQRLPAKA